jgi:inorganic triphosphatase YgiF
VEVELKFRVPAARRAAVQRAVATAAARTTRLQAVYADTPERALAQAGLALRLRKEGRQWVQALKGRGDGLASRLEHEVALPPQRGTPALDPLRHAGTAAGDALQAALQGNDALQEQLRTDIRRLHRRVRSGGALIEIAFDQGRLIAGGRQADVCEIEFELVSGPPAALPALAQRWVQRFGLWWDVRTKAERGYRLAIGADRVPAARATAPDWQADAGAGEAWLATLHAALAQALPNAAEIASGTAAPEHLHQLRVGLRRLRTALRLLSPWGGQAEAAHALEADWRAPFAQLGAARDADVQALRLAPQWQAAGAPDLPQPAPPADADPGAIVRSAAFNLLLLRALALAMQPPVPEGPPDAPPWPKAADELLRSIWRQVRRDSQAFAGADTAQQHRTRKRLKRLRHLLEALQPLYPRKPMRRLLTAVGVALDALGDLNDLHAAEAAWRTQAQVDARAWFAVGWLAARREPAQARAAATLAALEKAPRPWRR